MRFFIILASVAGLLMGGAVLAQGPGSQLGWWGWRDGLGMIRTLALPSFGVTALALIGFLLSLRAGRGLAALAGVGLVVSAAASFIPFRMKQLADGNPFIHDITTDFVNPPQIVAGANAPRTNPPVYVGDEPEPARGAAGPSVSGVTTAQAQRDAFPDIKPLRLAVDKERAVGAARATLKRMGLETLAENDDPISGVHVIEAVATSRWFGFKDDFIVRLTPKTEGGVVVDVRSKSRVGKSDLGANAARIRKFLKLIEKEARAAH